MAPTATAPAPGRAAAGEARDRPGPDPVTEPGRVAGDRRLLLHLLALVVVLGAVAALVGDHGRYSGDEGAAAITARSLADGRGWITPHPLASVDPTGHEYPLELSTWGADGVSAYAKHPTYPLVLSVADRLGGPAGMVALSVLGTALAALAAALLARRLDPAYALPTLWVVGVGSPLLFDSQLLIAHTLGAAAAGLAALAVDSARTARGVRAAGAVAVAAAACGATVLLRTEGVFLGLGLGVALLLSTTGPWLRRLALAAVPVGSAALAYVLDHEAVRWVAGAPVADPTARVGAATGSGGLVADRLRAFRQTVLAPGYASGTGPLLLLLAAVLLVVVVVALRQGRVGGPRAAALTLVVAALVVVRAGSAPDAVPGLLVAWPVGWVGLALLRREDGRDPRRRLLLAASAVFVAAVLATQYAIGGGVEWGGRYFALALPLVGPVAVASLHRAVGRLDRADARRVLAGGVAVVAALGVAGVRELRATEGTTTRFVERVAAVAASTGDRPVVVTTEGLVPRASWATFDRQRWLLADPDRPDHLVRRLRRAGIDRFTFVTPDPARDRRLLAGARVVRTTVVDGWRIQVLAT